MEKLINNFMDLAEVYERFGLALRLDQKTSGREGYILSATKNKREIGMKVIIPCNIDVPQFVKNCGTSVIFCHPHTEGSEIVEAFMVSTTRSGGAWMIKTPQGSYTSYGFEPIKK